MHISYCFPGDIPRASQAAETGARSFPKRVNNALALLMLFLLATLGGCNEGAPAISIVSPEAQLSPTFIGVASVFMKIANTGTGADMLVGARVDIPGTVTELHDILDGRMKKVDGIAVPAGKTIRLRPAGNHIMILNIPKQMPQGTAFELTLTFRKAGEKRLSLTFSRP
jgi:copper(I)-binding protein